jgi:Abortive infection C-terminus
MQNLSLVRRLLSSLPRSGLVQCRFNADLPKLWALTAESVNLAPHQHQESVFKAILGNCQSVVNHLGSIRNKIGDAHGQGRHPVRPKARHAELAVNLAGTMTAFLISTWKERQEIKADSD